MNHGIPQTKIIIALFRAQISSEEAPLEIPEEAEILEIEEASDIQEALHEAGEILQHLCGGRSQSSKLCADSPTGNSG